MYLIVRHVLLIFIGVLLTTSAHSSSVLAKMTTDDFRGSSFIYRNAVSTYSFDRSAEPTYNPYYNMQLTIAIRAEAIERFTLNRSAMEG